MISLCKMQGKLEWLKNFSDIGHYFGLRGNGVAVSLLVIASACTSHLDRANENKVPEREILYDDGVELASDTFEAAKGRYREALDILYPQAERNDPVAKQAYSEILIWWYRHPNEQGGPSISADVAWKYYRDAAADNRSAFSSLRWYYNNGAPGLEKNKFIADCMLYIWLHKKPISSVVECYALHP